MKYSREVKLKNVFRRRNISKAVQFRLAASLTASLSVAVVGYMVAPSRATHASVDIYVSQSSGVDTNPGTEAQPVLTLAKAVQLATAANAAGQTTHVHIGPGTYRESMVFNAGGTTAAMTIEGEDGAIISGADVWSTGWTGPNIDGVFEHDWPYDFGVPALPSGWADYWGSLGVESLRDRVRRSEQIFIADFPLQPRLSLADLSAQNTFYVDEAADKIYMKPPSWAIDTDGDIFETLYDGIEVSLRRDVFKAHGRSNLTVRNLQLEKARAFLQDGGSGITNSTNVWLDKLNVRRNVYSGMGVATSTNVKVTDSKFNQNGVGSFGFWRVVNGRVSDVEMTGNNWRGWPNWHRDWDVTSKWLHSRDIVLERMNVHTNNGYGIWLDSDNQRFVVRSSLMKFNATNLFLEANEGPVYVLNNRICDGWEWGLRDAQSDNVNLINNKIFNNTRWNIQHSGDPAGRDSIDWETSTTYTSKAYYWNMIGNTIQGSGAEGWLWWFDSAVYWPDLRASFVNMDNNTWYHAGRTTAFKMPAGDSTHATFQADMQTANAGFEAGSTWTDPGTLTCEMPPDVGRGDLNYDGKTNIFDLSMLLADWGDSGLVHKRDINNNGTVDIFDLSIQLSDWTGS